MVEELNDIVDVQETKNKATPNNKETILFFCFIYSEKKLKTKLTIKY